jgi:hypothetical protein
MSVCTSCLCICVSSLAACQWYSNSGTHVCLSVCLSVRLPVRAAVRTVTGPRFTAEVRVQSQGCEVDKVALCPALSAGISFPLSVTVPPLPDTHSFYYQHLHSWPIKGRRATRQFHRTTTIIVMCCAS